MKSCENVKSLSERINGYMEKFDKIKDEMGTNSKKFEGYQQDIETKKLKIQVLETEIQNIQLGKEKHKLVQAEIDEEKKRAG